LVSLAELVRRAESTDAYEMLKLIRQVESILEEERRSGEQGDIKVDQGLVRIPPSGELTVVGDIHGDMDSLAMILSESRITETATGGKKKMLFLGDYGDRGNRSIEVYHIVLSLKAAFPERVILLRGNHEWPKNLRPVPYDLPSHIEERFHEGSHVLCEEFPRLFDALHQAALVEEKYLFLHGGVPSLVKSLGDIANANLTHPEEPHLEEILWNDPSEELKGTAPSPRGAGKIFGDDVTSRILELVKAKTLIRGHEPCPEGVALSHRGIILTLFSRKGFPYGNVRAAYLTVDLSEPSRSGYALLKSASLF